MKKCMMKFTRLPYVEMGTQRYISLIIIVVFKAWSGSLRLNRFHEARNGPLLSAAASMHLADTEAP